MIPDRPARAPARYRLPTARSVWTGAMLGIVYIALVFAIVTAMRMRGPWYDEFYTLYVARPGIPLHQAVALWLADNHPPLFYALTRATAWAGATIEERRILNLFLLVGACIQIAWWLIPPGLRRIGWVFAIALASAWPAIDRAAELRSNYLAFAAAAVALAALVGYERGQRAHPRIEWAMLTLALLIALNVHLAASIVVGGLVAATILRRLLAHEGQSAVRLTAAATLAAAPMLLHLALSFGRIEANTRDFWIKGGFAAARWSITFEVERILTANLPVTILAVAGFLVLAYRSWQDRRLAAELDRAITLGVGLVIACVLMVAVHLWRPFIIDRYLVTLHPAIAMILALGASALLERIRPLFAVLLSAVMTIATLLAIQTNMIRTVSRASWYDTGRTIAAIRRGCPSTLVHVDWNGNRRAMAAPPTENRAVFPYAYRLVAARYGFALAADGDRSMARDCPTLFWTEHVAGENVTEEGLAAQLRADGFPIGRTRLIRVGDGHVLETWPAR